MTSRDWKFPLVYIHNRWVSPSHQVTIKHPDCPRGHYRDADTIMLYAAFQILVDFVEVECAGLMFNKPYFETPGQKVYRVIRDLPVLSWLLPPQRNIRRGLYHLRWSMRLTEPYSEHQAQQAKDVFALYKWWTHTRPDRIDPWDWADIDLTEPKRTIHEDGRLEFSSEYSALLEKAGKLEDKYNKEDQKKLLMLIAIRRGLWT